MIHSPNNLFIGDRIATWMFYLSKVNTHKVINTLLKIFDINTLYSNFQLQIVKPISIR